MAAESSAETRSTDVELSYHRRVPSPPRDSEEALGEEVRALVRELLALDWGRDDARDRRAWLDRFHGAFCGDAPDRRSRHRLGNLLSPAFTYAYLLTQREVLPAERDELMERLRASVERAAMLALSDDAGRPPPHATTS